ncbi:glycosyltransferase family 2 protein [Shewanella baltica]|uniref:glycosyltransferase family 2 protein n=1 Tax=Shewanella baltica TaxID=62322 RepID=UPI003D7B8177
MNEFPLVSIVIPMYNAEQYIVETLNSIKHQTYKNYEIIIVDNASTDSSVLVVEKMKSHFDKFKIIHSSLNSGGPARPRNIGIEHAEGEFIAFLDSDDLWTSEKLSIQLSYMIANKIDFSSTDRITFTDTLVRPLSEGRFYRFKKYFFKKYFSINMLIFSNCIFTSSVIVKRDYLLSGFDEDAALNTVEDFFLWISIIDSGARYSFLSDKLLGYRSINTSLSAKNSIHKNKAKNSYAVLRYILNNNAFHLYPFFKMRQVLRFIGF